MEGKKANKVKEVGNCKARRTTWWSTMQGCRGHDQYMFSKH